MTTIPPLSHDEEEEAPRQLPLGEREDAAAAAAASSVSPADSTKKTNSDQKATAATTTTMKAIVQDAYGTAEEVLRLAEDVERPTIQHEDDVFIRVRAAGVDLGVWHVMTGLPYLVRLAFGLRRPWKRIPGLDVAGVVEAVGKGVTRFKVGDEVFGVASGGSFAEFVCTKESALVLKPTGISFEQAAATAISGVTALQAVRDVGQVKPGDRVLVIGAGGGVGSFAVQIASKSLGAVVTGLCSSAKLEFVRSIGAQAAIDYTARDIFSADPAATEQQETFDVIIDTAGNRPLSHLRRALTAEGTLVIVGGEGGGNWFGGVVDRQLAALVLSLFTKQRLRPLSSLSQPVEDLEQLRELMASGKLVPALDKTFPLERAADAVGYIGKGHTKGKVVLTVSSSSSS